MVFKSKVSRPPKEPEQPASKPVLPDERKAEVPRHVQHSFISADTTVTGDLESTGDISVEGSVEGNITCRTLTLRGEPTIMGDVHAEAVHVCGRFTGALRAKNVVLTKAARMTGDIYYETLKLQEGAEFEGGFRCTGGSALKPVTRDAAAPQEGPRTARACQVTWVGPRRLDPVFATYPYKIFDVPPTRLSLFGSFTHAVVI